MTDQAQKELGRTLWNIARETGSFRLVFRGIALVAVQQAW
jgi:hypothetical protein